MTHVAAENTGARFLQNICPADSTSAIAPTVRDSGLRKARDSDWPLRDPLFLRMAVGLMFVQPMD
jgi:hypothetical protein